MTPEQFAYWLQGFVELNGDMPTAEQWASIKEHLATVFVKVTPPVKSPTPLSDALKILTRHDPSYPSITDKFTC